MKDGPFAATGRRRVAIGGSVIDAPRVFLVSRVHATSDYVSGEII
jgi:hypothetical protein